MKLIIQIIIIKMHLRFDDAISIICQGHFSFILNDILGIAVVWMCKRFCVANIFVPMYMYMAPYMMTYCGIVL